MPRKVYPKGIRGNIIENKRPGLNSSFHVVNSHFFKAFYVLHQFMHRFRCQQYSFNEYETAPYFIQFSQNLTVISVFSPKFLCAEPLLF